MVSRDGGGKAALICGSVAYDTILLFPDRFKSHILPDKIHILNVSFLVPEMRREFGGCAANIAYSLNLLGDRGVPMATAGHDFAPYRERMRGAGHPRRAHQGHRRAPSRRRPSSPPISTTTRSPPFIPGAMQHAHLNKVADAGAQGRARDRGAGRPPGHDRACGAVRRSQDSLHFRSRPGDAHVRRRRSSKTFIAQARWVAVNDYEWGLLQQKTGLTRSLRSPPRWRRLIVTRGAEGSVIYAEGRTLSIPCAKPRAVVDPTGCGDAYRAGLIHGLLHGLDWETIGRTASLMGAIKIESRGPQNHRFTRAEFDAAISG